MDLAGKEWKRGTAVPGTRIDLGDIPEGILIAEIRSISDRDEPGKIIRMDKILRQR
jgi:hypothetical protein